MKYKFFEGENVQFLKYYFSRRIIRREINYSNNFLL